MSQAHFEEIILLLTQAVVLLNSEGLNDFATDTQKLINSITVKQNIILSHKHKLYSICRMMLETNTYYNSKASSLLDKAYELINETLAL